METGTDELWQHASVNRRNFIRSSFAGAMALSLPFNSISPAGKRMGVVVHSYGSRWNSKTVSQKYPGFADAMDLLIHCHAIGASGIQVGVKDWTEASSRKLRQKREQLGLYIEGSIGVPFKQEQVAQFEKEVLTAKEAGVQILRTVCSAGRRYEIYHTRQAFDDAQKMAMESMRLSEPILKKYQMKLAVENHKDWRAVELAEMMKQMSSEWIGVTLDFGNSIALMEDPMEVVRTLAPYLLTTHVKDMAVDEYSNGILLSEVPLGKGILDLKEMIEICEKANPKSTFNLEMITRDPLEIPCLTNDYWQTFTSVPGNDLARTLRMTRAQKFQGGLPRVSQMTTEDRLAVEEKNIVDCLSYSSNSLGLK
ncbi:MAG: sugar phosphate isomerase/epimerase family protein [Chryseolinea sp.]